MRHLSFRRTNHVSRSRGRFNVLTVRRRASDRDRTWHGANRWPAFLANALRAAFRIVRSSSLRVHLCSTGRALHRRAPPPSRIGVLCVARTDGAILIPMVNSIWAPGSAYALYFSSAIRCPYCSRDLEVGRPISRCSTVRTPWGAAGECVRCRNFRPCGTVSPTLLPCTSAWLWICVVSLMTLVPGGNAGDAISQHASGSRRQQALLPERTPSAYGA